MKSDLSNGILTIYLEGQLDSSNASAVAEEFKELINNDDHDIVLDVENLNYISSAGLRVLLRIRKKTNLPIRIVNISDEVFHVFEITGFTKLFEMERAMREISIEDCEKISSAINGEYLQLSSDEMIKVFSPTVPLSEIKRERSYAQTAMVCGVPTLIPYDVVKCGDGYGIVYEKSEIKRLANVISQGSGISGFYAKKLGSLMSELHSCVISDDSLPDIKDRYRKWIQEIDDPNDSRLNTFSNLIDSIPDSDSFVYGDLNLNSIMVQDGELLLLDMSGSAKGNALFDLQALYASLVGIENLNPGYCRKTFGLNADTCQTFWWDFFDNYLKHDQKNIALMNELLKKYFVLKEAVLNRVADRYKK